MTNTSTQQQAPPPRGRSAIDDGLERLRTSDLRRDTDRRWFGGVCAGLAARFGVDPLLIRAAAIALTIAGGVGLPVYLLLWLLMPDAHGTVLAERALRHGDAWPVVLGVVTTLFVLGGLFSLSNGGNGWGGSVWLLIPVGLVVWFLATRSSRAGGHHRWSETTDPGPYGTPYGGPATPPPPPGGSPMSGPTNSAASATAPATATATTVYGAVPGAPTAPYGFPPAGTPGHPLPPYGGSLPPAPPFPPRPMAPPPPPAPRRRRPSGYVGLVSLGAAVGLVGLGVALAGPVGYPGEPVVLGFVLALAALSVLVLGLAVSGRAAGFSGFLVVVLGGLTVFGALATQVPLRDGGTARVWTPTASALPIDYHLGVGQADLDLRGLASAPLTGGPASIDVSIGVGELRVIVPEGLDVRIENHVDAGDVRTRRAGANEVVAPQNGDTGTDFVYDVVTGAAGRPDLIVKADIGLGGIIIEEN